MMESHLHLIDMFLQEWTLSWYLYRAAVGTVVVLLDAIKGTALLMLLIIFSFNALYLSSNLTQTLITNPF